MRGSSSSRTYQRGLRMRCKEFHALTGQNAHSDLRITRQILRRRLHAPAASVALQTQMPGSTRSQQPSGKPSNAALTGATGASEHTACQTIRTANSPMAASQTFAAPASQQLFQRQAGADRAHLCGDVFGQEQIGE